MTKLFESSEEEAGRTIHRTNREIEEIEESTILHAKDGDVGQIRIRQQPSAKGYDKAV